MRIIEDDCVDWEPLGIHFVPGKAMSRGEKESLVQFVGDWFNSAMESDPQLWLYAEPLGATLQEDGTVHAFCDLMPGEALPLLAEAVAEAFPAIDHIRIGTPLDGPTGGVEFDWVSLPGGQVSIADAKYSVAPLAISFTPVTIGQFMEFMQDADYTPVPDTLEHQGYLVEHFQLNHGKSPKYPLFGVTLDDGLAYCEWAGLRLPTEPELHHFFDFTVRQGRKFDWGGDCWTTTSTAPDRFVVRNGPYRLESLNDSMEDFRAVLHRHHYEFLEAPCFRVAKSLRDDG